MRCFAGRNGEKKASVGPRLMLNRIFGWGGKEASKKG